ncbi:hypothetical protein AB1E18_000501 [Capra hircus]
MPLQTHNLFVKSYLGIESFPGDSDVKNLPAMQETWVQSLDQEDSLEKGMSIHSNRRGPCVWLHEGDRSHVLKEMKAQNAVTKETGKFLAGRVNLDLLLNYHYKNIFKYIRDGMGREMGGKFEREGTYLYLWLIHVAISCGEEVNQYGACRHLTGGWLEGAADQASCERARSCLPFLVSQLASMEHSFHHILLLEIKSITDTFSSILGPQSRDIFRMSNSFTAISKLLTRQLETTKARNDRSKSLALHTVLTNPSSAEDGEAIESRDTPASVSLSEIDPLGQGHERSPFKADTDGSQLVNSSVSHQSIIHVASEDLPEAVKTNYQEETPETTTSPVEYHDKLYLHLKENFSKVKAYAIEMVKKIPVPDQCTIEDLDDSPCPLVGHDIFSQVTALIEKSQEGFSILYFLLPSPTPDQVKVDSHYLDVKNVFLMALNYFGSFRVNEKDIKSYKNPSMNAALVHFEVFPD